MRHAALRCTAILFSLVRSVNLVLSRVFAHIRHADGSLECQGSHASLRLSICITGPSRVSLLFAAQHGGLLLKGVGKLAGVVVV